MFSISRTRPFQRFQKAAGISTFHINTIVVGLELVALGGEKPNDLNIKWKPPSNPRNAVEQTKKFVLLAILAHVVDAFDVLLREYAELEWTSIDQDLKNILRKSVTKPNKDSYSIRERTEALLGHLQVDHGDALAALDLMVSWRNSLVHAKRGRWILSESTSGRLLERAETFAERYAGIDIKRALEALEKRSWPTLKEATTMVAICQNLARSVDEGLIRREANTPEKIQQIAKVELAGIFGQSEAKWNAIGGRSPQKRYKVLATYLHEAGIAESQEGISAALGSEFLDELVRSTRTEIEEMLSKTGKYIKPDANSGKRLFRP